VADRCDAGPPVVTVRGGPAQSARDPRAGAALRVATGLLAATAVVLAVVQGQREERPRTTRQPAPPVTAELRLVSGGVSISQDR